MVTIKEKMRVIPLEDGDRAYSAWCEAQFRLSEAPGYDWLRTVHEELNADWNIDCPHHVRSRLGFDVSFEGDVMSLVCRDFQLANDFRLLNEAVLKTNALHMRLDKNLHKRLEALNKARNELIARQHATVEETLDETLVGYAEWYRKRSADLKEAFNDLKPC